MVLTPSTVAALELLSSTIGDKKNSLFGILNHTNTVQGGLAS